MKGKIALLTAGLILGLVSNGLAQGAQTGTIRGTVLDTQRGVMPGVTVTVTSPALQGPRSIVTDGQGGFSLRNLPAGDYEITFELSGFAVVKQKSTLPLGLTLEENVTMQPANIELTVTVAAETPAPITTPIVGANFKHDEIDALATPRTLQGIATLAPGLTTNTPNRNQVVINGAFAFDNVFMVNGVDVNDNLLGSPQDLFIEDGIEETQVLASGIPAEYGRFTGGVVNAITKSGGNRFSGSFRTNFSNPQWTVQTPFEKCDPAVTAASCAPAPERPDDLQFVYEGTLGGPLVRDRLWFFGAGRHSKLSNASTLPITNSANVLTNTNKRGEIKVTGTPMPNHTIQGGYLNSPTEEVSRPTFSFTIDPAAVLSHPTYPNWYTFVNYRGVLGARLLGEAQYSTRKFRRLDTGGTSTNIVDSPIITLTQQQAHYNAPYFDSTDPEDRNNSQLTGNFTYFVDSGKRGRHEIKGGYEWFRSQNVGGNSQTATGYVIWADLAEDAAGTPLRDANGRLIPTFVPNLTQNENWIPVRGALINVDTQSLFAQDHWAINGHWSADLGVRYERARSEATGGLVGIDTDTIVPRLGASYDVEGNGRHIVHVTYGHYGGRYNEAQVNSNTIAGNPNVLYGVYVGPPGEGRDFAPGFDPSNYVPYGGIFPTSTVFFEEGLSAPVVREFTTSYGTSIRDGKGYAAATYIWRDTNNFIEDFITLSNGVTTVEENGGVFTFTNQIYQNTNIANRTYQALEFQGRHNLSNRWTLNGSYTVQLTNEGNYEGEAANQPGITSRIGDYPEIFDAVRHFPDGRLFNFQRHKLVLWSIYNAALGRFGDTSISGLWRVNSGTTYSLAAAGQPLTQTQLSTLSAVGYPDAPTDQTVYFDGRGSEQFAGYGVLDFDVNYNVPVFKTLRPWVKFDIFNLFNNQKLITWNTAVRQDPNSPKDSLGLATEYIQGSSFGKATANTNFPQPFYAGQVQTGGRTFLLAVGFRF